MSRRLPTAPVTDGGERPVSDRLADRIVELFAAVGDPREAAGLLAGAVGDAGSFLAAADAFLAEREAGVGETLFTTGDQTAPLPEAEPERQCDRPDDPRPPFAPTPPGRYQVQAEFARGGFARIFSVYDTHLGREVAQKRLRDHFRHDREQRQLLIDEGRLTGQLEHPNIVPVYDMGVIEPDEVYFTMRRVRGRSLHDLVGGLRTLELWRVRLLNAFQQVCMAVSYAHAMGVIHRDLKPANIMLGDFGEVFVMDWGVAGHKRDLASGGEGSIMGTPAFMSPEQARGERGIDERSDVFSLGGILHFILTGRAPFSGLDTVEVLQRVAAGPPPPPSLAAPGLSVPEPLDEICVRAMAFERADRFQSARALYEEIEGYLDGSRERQRQRQKAVRLAAEGSEEASRFERFRTAEAETASLLRAALDRGERGAAFRLELERQTLRRRSGEVFARARERLGQALALDPGCGGAVGPLTSLHLARFRDAERELNKKEMAWQRMQVQTLDPEGVHARDITGTSRVVLRQAAPPGTVFRFVRLVEGQDGVIAESGTAAEGGVCDGLEVTLPLGGYILMVENAAAGLSARHHLLCERGESQTVDLALRQPLAFDGLPFRHLPAGPFLKGGDREAFGYAKIRYPHLPEFWMAGLPVTSGLYRRFIAELAATDPDEARRRMPRLEPERGTLWEIRAERDGVAVEPPPEWTDELPVVLVSWADACAFAGWFSRRHGRRFRLPSENEWEKAARGVDGRLYPWGNGFDPRFCACFDRFGDGPASILAVGACPDDISPFGVRDMAGGVREWCDDWFDAGSGERSSRGGSWMDSALFCRCAGRSGFRGHGVMPGLGFRLALDG